MSKRKRYSKHIEKGKFYHFHEGSPRGHPGMVYWKNDKKNLYLAVTTDSTAGEHRTSLNAPTDSAVEKSYVYNRPLLAKRKDIGSEHSKMRFSKKDRKILQVVSRRNYRESPSVRSKDRRYIKKLKKKPKY